MRTSPTLSVEVTTRHSSLPVRTTPTMSMTSPWLDKIMPCEIPKSWSKDSMLPEYIVRTKRGASAPTMRMVPAMERSTAYTVLLLVLLFVTSITRSLLRPCGWFLPCSRR